MNIFNREFFQKRKKIVMMSMLLAGALVAWGFMSIKKAPPGRIMKNIFTKAKTEKWSVPETLEKVIPVRTTKAIRTDYRDFVSSFGTIKGFKEIPVKFEEGAPVEKFYFKEGEPIKKGELVIAQVQGEQKSKLEYAQIEYNKNKILYNLGAIIKDKLRQIELEVEAAKEALNKRNFYAPSDGFTGMRRVNEGELAGPGDIVTTFVEMGNVFCEVGIIEKEMDKVRPGQNAVITMDTFHGKSFEGIVDSVSPMLEGRSRTQNVKILVLNEKSLIIKPGMFSRADILTFEKKDAIVIPRKSLKKTEEGYIVFGVVRPEGGPKKSPVGFEEAAAKVISVKVERASEEKALISEGLTEGQEIILESPEAKAAIKDGSTIEIMPE